MLGWGLAAGCILLLQDPHRDLDSPDPVTARRAFEAAIRKGDEKSLEEAARTSERAKLALAEVRAHKRFGDAYPQPKTVTIDLKDAPFAEALAQFSAAAGISIQPYSPSHGKPPVGRITLRLEDAYLVEAIDQFSVAAEITIYPLPEGYRYTGGGRPAKKTSYARHMALSLRSIREERSANALGETRIATYLDFAGRSSGDVRIAAHGMFKYLEVWERPGGSLLLDATEKRPPTGAWSASPSFATGSYIKTPAADCEELSLVRGVLEIWVAETPRFDEWSLGEAAREIAGSNITFRLERVTGEGASVTVHGRIADSQKPHVRPVPADFALVSKDGRVLDAKGTVRGAQDAPEASLEFTVPDGFGARALRVRHFASFGSLEIPFEFHQVRIR